MEILELTQGTGKRHDHVLRDIETIISHLEDSPNLGSGFESSTYLAGNGKQERCFELTHDATVLLMTGYSIPMRAKLVSRWRELEEAEQKRLPKSFAEALQQINKRKSNTKTNSLLPAMKPA